MPYTVRLNGRTVATFDTEEEAVARARAILRDDADKQPEVLDAETGQPVAPGASKGSRDDLARKVGFWPSPPVRCERSDRINDRLVTDDDHPTSKESMANVDRSMNRSRPIHRRTPPGTATWESLVRD